MDDPDALIRDAAQARDAELYRRAVASLAGRELFSAIEGDAEKWSLRLWQPDTGGVELVLCTSKEDVTLTGPFVGKRFQDWLTTAHLIPPVDRVRISSPDGAHLLLPKIRIPEILAELDAAAIEAAITAGDVPALLRLLTRHRFHSPCDPDAPFGELRLRTVAPGTSHDLLELHTTGSGAGFVGMDFAQFAGMVAANAGFAGLRLVGRNGDAVLLTRADLADSRAGAP